MLDFAKLESSELVVLITTAMVCAENVERFLVAASGDKPSCANSCQRRSTKSFRRSADGLTGAFRNPPRQSNRDQRREDLNERYASPAPITLDRQRTQTNPSRNSRAEVVESIKER